jgi:hypothetical protein
MKKFLTNFYPNSQKAALPLSFKWWKQYLLAFNVKRNKFSDYIEMGKDAVPVGITIPNISKV